MPMTAASDESGRFAPHSHAPLVEVPGASRAASSTSLDASFDACVCLRNQLQWPGQDMERVAVPRQLRR